MSRNSREKRQAYYCSREWGLKREAVHKRSGGACERCFVKPGQAVHHKTYARLYNERLDDLWHLCDDCHDFVHGRGSVDHAGAQESIIDIPDQNDDADWFAKNKGRKFRIRRTTNAEKITLGKFYHFDNFEIPEMTIVRQLKPGVRMRSVFSDLNSMRGEVLDLVIKFGDVGVQDGKLFIVLSSDYAQAAAKLRVMSEHAGPDRFRKVSR